MPRSTQVSLSSPGSISHHQGTGQSPDIKHLCRRAYGSTCASFVHTRRKTVRPGQSPPLRIYIPPHHLAFSWGRYIIHPFYGSSSGALTFVRLLRSPCSHDATTRRFIFLPPPSIGYLTDTHALHIVAPPGSILRLLHAARNILACRSTLSGKIINSKDYEGVTTLVINLTSRR